MRYLSAITMLILALAITQPVEAQSFKPDYSAGYYAHNEKDYATARKHYEPLAKQGHANAQLMLGILYYYGKGVLKDYKQSAKWFRLSAEQNHRGAQSWLSQAYHHGQGVLQDLVMAYVWQNVAITKFTGVEASIHSKTRDEIRAKLTAPELKLARKLSKLCLKKPAKCPEYSDD